MNLKYKNKKINGILTVLPEKEVKFDDEIDNYDFRRSQSMKLKLIMGYDKRRVVEPGITVSDLCIYGLNHLFDNQLLKKEDIDAIVLVTQSPDYIMPGTSYIIQGKLNLKEDLVCLDINSGCSGYPIGLSQAFMLLDQDEINKVVLLNADILSTKVSINDRGSRPLTGDGASITIVEKDNANNTIYGTVNSDGQGAECLIIPAGGFKTPSSSETAVLEKDINGNFRALDHLYMKGDDVFNFVQTKVPLMIEKLLGNAECNKNEVDYFMFHQPNKFILKKLADKMDISYEKMPNNIVEKFGNSGSVSIPVAITFNLSEEFLNQTLNICIAGFGTGLSWSSMLIKFDKLDFCKLIDFK